MRSSCYLRFGIFGKLMRNIRFFDWSTKVLILSSIMGMIFGYIWWVRLGSFDDITSKDRTEIGKIVFFENDVRVKRFGSSHWMPVLSNLVFFENDLIFTGDSSSATLSFNSGESVKVETNSLLSVSTEKIQLENGSIDINVQSQSSLKLVSFGQVVSLGKKGSVKVINTDSEKNIVGDNVDQSSVLIDNTKSQVERKIILLAPDNLQRFPMLKGVGVQLQWGDSHDSEGKSSSYRIDFSLDSKFNNIFYSFKTNQSKLLIKSNKLKPGTIFLKITTLDDLSEPISISSQFIMHEETDFQVISPLNNASFHLEKSEQKLNFKWNNPITEASKVQIAKDSSFSDIIFEQDLVQKDEFEYVFYSNGIYFWRLGHVINNEVTWSSRIYTFTIKSPTIKEKVKFFNFSDTYNFTQVDQFTLYLNDPNKAKLHIVSILKDSKLVRDTKLSSGRYILEKLETGRYKIRIKSIFEDGTEVFSEDFNFNVIDGTPPPAPEVKQKDQDLFVKLLSFLFPIAHAAEKIELKWAKQASSDLSEIEIYRNDEIYHTSISDLNSYELVVLKPGTYTWRVRNRVNGIWSDFSKPRRLYAKDKITLFDNTLMQDVILDKKNNEIIFKWSEPSSEFKYFLEIYSKDDLIPLNTYEVDGGLFKMIVDQLPRTFRWRVFAKSSHGATSSNNETRIFTLEDSDFKKLNFEIVSVNSRQRQTINSNSTSFLNKKNNFNGIAYAFSYIDRFPWTSFHLKKQFTFRSTDLADMNDSYQSLDFMGEIGSTIVSRSQSYHDIYLGLQYSKTNIYFHPSSYYDYNFYFLTSRYDYVRDISVGHGFKFSAKGLLFVDFENPRVSLQLRSLYLFRLNSSININPFLSLERNTLMSSNVDGSIGGDLNISNNIFSIGLDFSYLF
jgi:hypothetical protein